jgi:hypothetical protein
VKEIARMDYRFTAILIILLCLLAIFVRPASNPSLKLDKKDYILPLPKPKVGIDNKAWNEIE